MIETHFEHICICLDKAAFGSVDSVSLPTLVQLVVSEFMSAC